MTAKTLVSLVRKELHIIQKREETRRLTENEQMARHFARETLRLYEKELN